MSEAAGVGTSPREGVLDRRRAGLLLHLGSLDAGDGGVLGARARRTIDWMSEAGFSVWQVLPVGPPGSDGSPYWVSSDYAGDTALVDLQELPGFPQGERSHGSCAEAADDFARHATEAARQGFAAFCRASRSWLEDYVLFTVLRRAHGGAPWTRWPDALKRRVPDALGQVRLGHAEDLQRERIMQYFFEAQWQKLRAYANGRGVRFFGDLPIYVAPDSVETWAHPEQFHLAANGEPACLGGVPPDYFTADGQLWGNPLYDWRRMRREGYAHWRARLRRQLERFDLVRLDHFRGLAAYWAVPAGAANARAGRWRRAGGHGLLTAFTRELGASLPLVAEDLGVITADVERLRDRFHLPGMRVLQFAFDGSADNPHLPHNHVREAIVYTGTHDNDTSLGWYRSLDDETRSRVDFYFGGGAEMMPDALVRAALASVARLAVLPVQDLLGLGREARLNTPGTPQGNWAWRLPPDALSRELAVRYRALIRAFGRG
ncbi:MAG: 4-alpha-glucanotransferase [Gammaproteobacteria bacterium]|nr:4-alpha-glucanotransferase [Gammaproteobacteria bacterium]